MSQSHSNTPKTPNVPQARLRPFVNGIRDQATRMPRPGEVILVRLPFDMPGPTSVISQSAISGSNNRNYHPCVVVNVHEARAYWELTLYVCRSFSGIPDPVAYVQSLPQHDRDYLLPVTYDPRPPTPPSFGAPLTFDNYVSLRPTWLVAVPVRVNMGGNSAYKPFHPHGTLALGEEERISAFTNTLPPVPTDPTLAVVTPAGTTPATGAAVTGLATEEPRPVMGGGSDGRGDASGTTLYPDVYVGLESSPLHIPPHWRYQKSAFIHDGEVVPMAPPMAPQDDDDSEDDSEPLDMWYRELPMFIESLERYAAIDSPFFAQRVAQREAGRHMENTRRIQEWMDIT